jgi:hypothetical protein
MAEIKENKSTKEERVEVFVPKGTANDDPNLYVSVNGENFLLPKGQVSLVPPYIKAAIERSYGAQAYQEKSSNALIAKTLRPTNQ